MEKMYGFVKSGKRLTDRQLENEINKAMEGGIRKKIKTLSGLLGMGNIMGR